MQIALSGSAGQSFGAFLVDGVDLSLEGDANDYVGKGISGGRLTLRHERGAHLDPSQNVIAGNTCLYGATGGVAYFGGCVGERFAVRNSGATAVVESVGDHACEYMTGGTVVILGATGRNLCAGMSGERRTYDPDNKTPIRINAGSGLVITSVEDDGRLRNLIQDYLEHTGSLAAESLLMNWDTEVLRFVRVISIEYQQLLDRRNLEVAVA